jgi:hypothetical protein
MVSSNLVAGLSYRAVLAEDVVELDLEATILMSRWATELVGRCRKRRPTEEENAGSLDPCEVVEKSTETKTPGRIVGTTKPSGIPASEHLAWSDEYKICSSPQSISSVSQPNIFEFKSSDYQIPVFFLLCGQKLKIPLSGHMFVWLWNWKNSNLSAHDFFVLLHHNYHSAHMGCLILACWGWTASEKSNSSMDSDMKFGSCLLVF